MNLEARRKSIKNYRIDWNYKPVPPISVNMMLVRQSVYTTRGYNYPDYIAAIDISTRSDLYRYYRPGHSVDTHPILSLRPNSRRKDLHNLDPGTAIGFNIFLWARGAVEVL